MGYDWDSYQQICYQLYIGENKPLEDIMEILRARHKFTPSKRAFQTQFRKWQFPPKYDRAHKNDKLVARIKSMWESNVGQQDMLRILKGEGYDISRRELMQVRTRNRWYLRVPHGDKSAAMSQVSQSDEVLDDSRPSSRGSMRSSQSRSLVPGASPDSIPFQGGPVTPGGHAEDEEDGSVLGLNMHRARKESRRRRRGRGYKGEAADAATTPLRYPSETTIDQARDILDLDNDSYRAARTGFQRICEKHGVAKKTLAGPETWERVKDELIQQVPQLQTAFWDVAVAGPAEDQGTDGNNDMDKKKLALDIICTDVTKRMRVLEKRMTIAEAKLALGIGPQEARQLRAAFFHLLDEARVQSKSSLGPEQWANLKERWMDGSELMQRILRRPGSPTPGQEEGSREDAAEKTADLQEKLKALEVIATDVMKRARDDKSKRDARRRKQPNASTPQNQPGPSTMSMLSPTTDNDDGEMVDDREDDDMGEEDDEQGLDDELDDASPSHNPILHHEPSPASLVESTDETTTIDTTTNGFDHVSPMHPMQLGASPAHTPLHVPTLPGLASQAAAAAAAAAAAGLPSGDLSMLDSSPGAGMSLEAQMGGSLLGTFVDVDVDHHHHQSYMTSFPPVPQAFHHQQHHHHQQQHHGLDQHHHHHAHVQPPPPPQPPPMAVPAYLRLHPQSTMVPNQTIWIATLGSHSLAALQHAAAEKAPGAICIRVDGILKDGKGHEMPLSIEQDAELAAYLNHLEGAAPTFDVQLVWSGG